jgi:hypothetical protein
VWWVGRELLNSNQNAIWQLDPFSAQAKWNSATWPIRTCVHYIASNLMRVSAAFHSRPLGLPIRSELEHVLRFAFFDVEIAG